MIAPSKQQSQPTARPKSALGSARRVVLETFLEPQRENLAAPKRWKTWALVGWLLLTALVFGLTAGWWTIAEY